MPTVRIPRKLAGMKTLVRLVASLSLLPAGIGMAADVPTFQSGEYQVTTSFGDSETLVKKVCLTNYADWFYSLRDDFKERGCNLWRKVRTARCIAIGWNVRTARAVRWL